MVEKPGIRSLNLATAVAIVAYEGLRQFNGVGKESSSNGTTQG